MDKLLSEDYLGIMANGEVFTKTQQLDRMRDRKFMITKLDTSEHKIKLIGNIAIVTSSRRWKAPRATMSPCTEPIATPASISVSAAMSGRSPISRSPRPTEHLTSPPVRANRPGTPQRGPWTKKPGQLARVQVRISACVAGLSNLRQKPTRLRSAQSA